MVTAPENQQQSMPQYKIVLYGESGAGKTSLLMKYMNPSHSEEQSPLSTIGIDFRAKTQVVEDKTVSLQIWDTAGQERFMSSINAFDKY
ncbi:MAG: GTPase Ryh1 [Paramarteilia canceri]